MTDETPVYSGRVVKAANRSGVVMNAMGDEFPLSDKTELGIKEGDLIQYTLTELATGQQEGGKDVTIPVAERWDVE